MKKIILSSLMVACIGFFIYSIYNSFVYTTQEIYEENWKIKFPEHITEIYDIHSPASFRSDGERYTIFQLNSSNMDMDGFYRGALNTDFAERILEKLEVPKEYYPVFCPEYLWMELTKYNDTLFIMYDEKNSIFYIFEERI